MKIFCRVLHCFLIFINVIIGYIYLSLAWGTFIFFFVGFLGSLFSLLQFICCPLIGAMSDFFGRRLLLMLCMVSKPLAFLKIERF